jgi:dihydropyrimidinase
MYGRKGTLAVGADADVVIWDPNKEVVLGHKTLHMRADYSPYEGRKMRGGPAAVLQRGKVLVRRDQFFGKAGDGQFIRRGTFNIT